jgi:sortase A
MRANKYGNFLTIILILLIIGILICSGILAYKHIIKPKVSKNKVEEAIAEFDRNVNKIEIQPDENIEFEFPQENVNTEVNNVTSSTTQKGTLKSKTYYEGFVMIGYINIPKTNIKLPILNSSSDKAIEVAVATIYPSNPKLNEPGNIVIIGHNYRDGRLFSNNKKLSVGDKILITDTTGRQLSYTIYQKFETTPEDTSFYNRDTNGIPEITLSTCTDDAKLRIIILARADQ